jgi:hypothetical protein
MKSTIRLSPQGRLEREIEAGLWRSIKMNLDGIVMEDIAEVFIDGKSCGKKSFTYRMVKPE